MQDSELPPNKPEGDLSAFEDALSDDILDSLPPENKSDEPQTEIGIIRKVLQNLSEEYGITYEIYNGRELGYELALNHRLDDMSHTAPRSLSDELTLSIQGNRVSEEQFLLLHCVYNRFPLHQKICRHCRVKESRLC